MTSGWLGDLRHGLRQLVRTRTFTIPAVLGLAVGIGAGVSVFSVFDAMLLRSMGFRDTRRIVSLWLTDPRHGQDHVEVSYADLLDWRKQTAVFEGVALASSVNLDFPITAGTGEPRQVDGTIVSGSFFQVLGAVPALGRLLTEDDDRPGATARAVLSNRLWRSEFGGDPNIIGRQIRSGPGSLTIVGVARTEFDFPRDVDVWIPLHAGWSDVEQNARLGVFRAVARLNRGVTIREATARMDVVARQLDSTRPAGAASYGILVTPMLDEVFGAAHAAAWVLLGSVLVVLLIACVNVANLLLARAAGQAREMAVRAVLGAGRWRLIRYLLAESLLLAAAGGALGIVLASVGIEALARLAPPEVPRIDQATLDLRFLASPSHSRSLRS